MAEKEPVKKSSDDFKNPLKEIEELDDIVKYFKNHRLVHRASNVALTALFFIAAVATPQGREALRDPQTRSFLFNREMKTGMLEGSVFNADLYFPNPEESSMEYRSAAAGRWISYDFYRKQEFGPKTRYQQTEGRLAAFLIDEIKDKGPDDYTPTSLLNIFDITHILRFDVPTIGELMENGLVRETRYKEAFEKVGLYSKYKNFLILSQIEENPLYTVTPKGNGLIMLARDGGDKVEKRKPMGALRPVFDGLFN